MKNAHLRMGTLRLRRRMKDTTVDVRVLLDRFIGEPAREQRVRTHLISVFGGDAEVAAVAAAVSEGSWFTVSGPGLAASETSLGEEAECFRGTISVPGRKRPVRHLVAVSKNLAETRRGGGNPGARRTVLCDDGALFVLYRLGVRFGLPVLPEWSDWFAEELARRHVSVPLIGLGCRPLLVRGTKKRFLGWIGHALKHGRIEIPDEVGAVRWPRQATFLSS